MYLSKETIASAISDLKGTAHPLLKVWLTLKAMGLDITTPVIIDTKNSTSALKRLFNSGDPDGRFYVPFSPTPSDEWMQRDASRSIVQTTIKKWFDGTITTVDPRGYLTITKENKKYKVSTAPTYPQGLGDGSNGFSRTVGQTLAVPITQFAVWVFCREEIPEDTADVEKYLCDKLRSLLHLDANEEQRVFSNKLFTIETTEMPITDSVVYALCGGEIKIEFEDDLPQQLITYGAPGTGKSHRTKLETEGHTVYRTTFHPDSDYSTFVGAYKPTMEDMEVDEADQHLTIEQLAGILKKEYDAAGEGSDKGKALAVDLYAEKYFQYLDGKFGKVSLMDLVSKAGLTKGYMVGLRDSINVAKYHALERRGQKQISYDFVPQAFIKAYVDAWRKWAGGQVAKAGGGGAGMPEPVFLVIEEINRGNCAQIFGDLFQLLDRDEEGYSEYAVDADADLARWLAGKFSGSQGLTALLPADVASGKKLMLPPNLYIRATMNTSDQSLFPIDSAFKRRWEWKYVPIAKPTQSGWKDRVIIADGKKYDWWEFLTKANTQILDTTKSEDKQLGYFFVKAPDATGHIKADRFTGKVLFYLYNDVFKDYSLPPALFGDGTSGSTKYEFKMFFDEHGETIEKVVAAFLDQLKVLSTPLADGTAGTVETTATAETAEPTAAE